jgi:hypothetical protein
MSLESIAAEASADDKLAASADPGTTREGEHIPAGGAAADPAAQFEAEAREWAGFPYVIGGLLSKAMPELAGVYTETACVSWGRAMVPVARKYGWTVGALGPLAGLASASWSLLSPTFDALKRRRAQHEKAPQAQPDAAPQGAAAEDLGEGKPAATYPDGSPIT